MTALLQARGKAVLGIKVLLQCQKTLEPSQLSLSGRCEETPPQVCV